MSRRTNLLVTLAITFLALLLGLQLEDPESLLMRYRSTYNAASKLLLPLHPHRRAFTPFASSSFSSSATIMSQPRANPEQPLGLPEPSTADATKLDMSSGSDTVKLDHLGPLVVNKDGTLSRISNWEQMTEQERKSTLKVLGKRNQARREVLSKEEEEEAKGKE